MKEMLRFKLSSLHNNVLIRSRINFSRIEFPDEKLETNLIVKLINLCRNRLCIYKNLQSVRNKCVLFAINIFISRKVASDFNSDILVQFVKKSIECYSIVIELVSLISSNYISHGEQLGYNNNNNNRRQYSIVRIARIESSPRSNFRSIISHFFPPLPLRLLFFPFSHLSNAAVTGLVVLVVVVVVVGVVRAARVLSPLNDHRVFIRGKRRVL